MKFKAFAILGLFVATSAFASVEDEAARIIDLFYDLRFDQAIAASKTLEEKHPEHPAGDFYASIAYYQRYLLEDPPEPQTFAVFLKLSESAREKAVRQMSPSPAISHYYQGAALGFQARALIAQKKYGSAIPKARQGVAHLKAALSLDPSLEDANLGLGMYYYFLQRAPAAAKPFAYMLIGMKGDRAKGLALLERTREKGRVARMEATSILAAIYASEKEKDWNKAFHLYKELMESYPHNPRYRLKLVYVLQRQGHWEQAIKIMDADGSWVENVDPFIRERAHAVARCRTLENLLFLGRYEEAGKLLDKLEANYPSGLLKDWILLRRGNYWDALGEPKKAESAYEQIKDKKASRLAETFKKAPFPQGPRDVMPSRWPLSSVPE